MAAVETAGVAPFIGRFVVLAPLDQLGERAQFLGSPHARARAAQPDHVLARRLELRIGERA